MTNPTSQHLIHVSYINIRKSISFLILNLVIIEVVNVILIVFSSLLLVYVHIEQYIFSLLLVIFNACLSFYVIFQWLNEYYELTPTYIGHKKGFFFKHNERYTLSNICSIELEQHVLGRLFNYGSIHFYDKQINRHFSLYLIHNPKRYFIILQELLPNVDVSENKIREYLMEDNE